MSTYQFTDVIEAPGASGLPAEAVKFNGVWLDEVVPGFRTLHVTGRDLLGADIEGYEVGDTMGEYFRRKKYRSRTIVVTFQLMAETDEAFREAFNLLNSYLWPKQAQIIFNDEPDKYFTASSAEVGEPEPGLNNVTGEISFFCADPRKYSLTKKAFIASTNADGILEADIVNAGTVPVPIDFAITNKVDNGYIGIAGPDGAIQLGFPDETDGESYKQNEQLVSIDNIFDASTDSGTNYMYPYFVNGGSMGIFEQLPPNRYLWLTAKPGANQYNGAMKTIAVPADSQGAIGAKNFYCYMRSWFQAANINQCGVQTIAFLDASNNVICGYMYAKTAFGNWNSRVEFWANGKKVKTINESAGTTNNSFAISGGNGGHTDIGKEGSKITFHWRGTYPSFIVPEVENSVCTKIQIGLYAWGDNSAWPLNKYGMTRNYLQHFNFSKLYVDQWDDVPNRYAAGDVVEINGELATVTVNGLLRTGDEVVGSQYFKAAPGTTPVLFSASDWAGSDPIDAVATIREAWI